MFVPRCGCALSSQSDQVQAVRSDVSRYLLKHAYLQSDTHTHTRYATLHTQLSVCHGKLGCGQSQLLGDFFAIYGAFFFLRLLLLVLFSFFPHNRILYIHFWNALCLSSMECVYKNNSCFLLHNIKLENLRKTDGLEGQRNRVRGKFA